MKKYTFNGITTDSLPGSLKLENGTTVHGITEELFEALGGTIEDDGEPSPKEKFLVGLDAYLDTLEEQVEAIGLSITKDEFKEAAATKMSADLIAWAKSKGVPDAMIDDVRTDILTMVADASRIGLTWGDIFPPKTSAPVQPTEQVQVELF